MHVIYIQRQGYHGLVALVLYISMQRSLPYIIILSILTIVASHASVIAPTVFVQNYTVEDHKASCQSWDLAVSQDGILYVANNSGLVTFDGNTWKINPLPIRTPIYNVAIYNDTIYTRGNYSRGYWLQNDFGDLIYHPLEIFPAHVHFSAPQPNYFIPKEIEEKRPTCFAKVAGLNFTGTATAGIYITNDKGAILLHLNIDNQLQDNIIRTMYVQDEDRIWAALDNGISLININPAISLLEKRSVIGKLENGIKKGDQIYIQTNVGFFSHSLNHGDKFVPETEQVGESYFSSDSLNNKLSVDNIFHEKKGFLGDFSKAKYIYPAPGNLYWLSGQNEAGLFHFEKGNPTLKCRILLDNYNLSLINTGRQIIPLNDSLDLLSAKQGALLLNTRKLIQKSLCKGMNLKFSKIEYFDQDSVHHLPLKTRELKLPHNFQQLSLCVGTSVTASNHQISYTLEGISSNWSSWQKEGQISFLQLPEGKYKLRVRKYVIRGPFPEICIDIIVRPAWYNTIWAYILYFVLVVFIIQFGFRLHLKNIRQEEKERMRIEHQAEQQRLQQMKNEFLETELQNKNNELTLQTSALVKRNEAIQTLLEELDRQKETLGDRYPNKLYTRLRSLMESSLNDQADWVQFETYFNSAHQNFMARLRQQYSEITAGDLRICCLLRMNLSTKEIASLMNVSVRAIELRRYRLRKRLALDTDTNLVDFLMNY